MRRMAGMVAKAAAIENGDAQTNKQKNANDQHSTVALRLWVNREREKMATTI